MSPPSTTIAGSQNVPKSEEEIDDGECGSPAQRAETTPSLSQAGMIPSSSHLREPLHYT